MCPLSLIGFIIAFLVLLVILLVINSREWKVFIDILDMKGGISNDGVYGIYRIFNYSSKVMHEIVYPKLWILFNGKRCINLRSM